MKTAINLVTLLLLLTFIIFLNTITYQKPSIKHPPPKSTRIISPSSKSGANPFADLQNSAQTLTNQELKSAIKTEWAKLENRSNNRGLPKLITLLRELGRRDGLSGIDFLETFPPLTIHSKRSSTLDLAQAKIAVIAGWGLHAPKAAATFLYNGHGLPASRSQ